MDYFLSFKITTIVCLVELLQLNLPRFLNNCVHLCLRVIIESALEEGLLYVLRIHEHVFRKGHRLFV